MDKSKKFTKNFRNWKFAFSVRSYFKEDYVMEIFEYIFRYFTRKKNPYMYGLMQYWGGVVHFMKTFAIFAEEKVGDPLKYIQS